jgi:chemotaxis protein histidine kinase CheA
MRRPDVARRNSPASQTLDQARSALEATDSSSESIRQLTEKLNSLRQELDDMERQILEEDQDFVTQKAILVDKRDEKKAALKEKEDASRDLRKEVATLERQNASAQTRRAQQEKVLRQKEAERKKAKDDMAKWIREAVELREAAERIAEERIEYEASSEARVQSIKEKHAEELQSNKNLEDAIREKGIQIKALEEERHALEQGQEGGEAPDGTDSAEREEDNRWKMTLGLLQQQYAQAWTLYSEAERVHIEASNRLNYLQQRRMSQPQMFTSPPVPELGPVRRNSQRARPLSMREGLLSASTGGFVHTSNAQFNTIPTTSSPSFANITPYLNIANGMALPSPRNHNLSFSQADFDNLTGGAPMSPTAGALLPAGLFADDLGLTDTEDEHDPGPPQAPSLDPSPHLRNVLPGLGAPGTIERNQDPSSPVSPTSRSPSAFASPRDSAAELQQYTNNYNDNGDSDKRSIRSTSSSFQIPQASRFGGLFGLHRQRGKTFSDEGPALGSLKPSQSQSLPRQDHGPDGAGGSRRRGSHSEGAWYDTFIRTKTQPVESSNSPNHVSTRKRPFNMFGTKADPWLTSMLGFEKPPSPRQGSTKSGEGMALPRPSTESQTRFGWSVDAFGARSSPLGVDWSVNNTNTTSWSRMPSRRPSMQYGSTTNLAGEDSMHDDVLDFPSTTRSPAQAPIGTRPQSSASHLQAFGTLSPVPPTPPRLNPAAASFSIPPLGKKTDEDKAEKAKKAVEKAAEKEARKVEKAEKKEEKEKRAKAEKAEKAARKGKDKQLASDASVTSEATSPRDARMSRDTPSIISTADASESSPRESLERSISHTPSDLTGSVGKESFMQKLTRKGSTNQFLTFGMKNTLFSKTKTADAPGTPDETNEDSGFLGLGRSTESVGNSPSIGTPKDKSSALSWSSIKKLGKKDKAPSLHESIASEATGDDEDSAFGTRERA